MRPGIDPKAGARADLEAEGADYASAFLDRVGHGATSPDQLASLMQFMHSGDMVHGFAAVIHEALRRCLVPGVAHGPA